MAEKILKENSKPVMNVFFLWNTTNIVIKVVQDVKALLFRM